MQTDMNNPQEELRRLKKVIRQYEMIMKTSPSNEQMQRVGKQLKELRIKRDEILATFHIDEDPEEEKEEDVREEKDPEKEYAYLKIIQKEYKLYNPEDLDNETYSLFSYFKFFDQEFFPFLSERMLKPDFKYSLDRDNFYYKFQDIQRMLDDFTQELLQLDRGEYRKEEEIEIRKRNMKRRRILMMEANKFFIAIGAFTEDLLDDIAQEGSKCLNSDDTINFDSIEGKKYLEGYRVARALKIVKDYSEEVSSFLNIPEFEMEE